jgi:pimeloyl-ACP methyl ester carboxylesterase
VVVGASLGGITAMIAEGETPGVTAAVILVDVAARIEVAGAERVRAFMTAFPEGFASLEEAADVVASYLPHRPRPRQLGGLTKSLRQGPDGRWRWHWDPRFLGGSRPPSDVANPPRLAAAARGLTVPTLLVRGRQSDVLSEDGAQDFLTLVPHARYVDVSEAGHMVAGDRNDLFTDAVVRFLATLPQR